MEQAERGTSPFSLLALSIECVSPLAVGERKPTGRAAEAMNYIAGGLIRGALAELILNLNERNQKRNGYTEKHAGECLDPGGNPIPCDFCDLFLRPQTAGAFRNAYAITKPRKVRHTLPSTARSCKDKSGFRKGDYEKHGVFDTLIDRFCHEQLGTILPYSPTCPTCGGRTDPISGIYSLEDSTEGKDYRLEVVPKRLLTRVAINRRRLTSEDELLYSFLVLSESEPASFTSYVTVPSSLRENVKKLLAKIDHLGGGSSRGLGQVNITVEEPREERSDIANRVSRFNEVLEKRWSLHRRLPHEESRKDYVPGQEWSYFTVGLQSDAVLFDDSGWQSVMVLSDAILKREAGCSEPVELARSYAASGYRGGWNSAWGLPKDMDVTTTAGSLFVYRTPTSSLPTWLSGLSELETRGVGERCQEGFGEIRICDEFHLINRQEAV